MERFSEGEAGGVAGDGGTGEGLPLGVGVEEGDPFFGLSIQGFSGGVGGTKYC